MDFNQICINTSPMYAIPDKQLLMYLRDTFTLHVDRFHNLDPLNHLSNEISDTQIIMNHDSGS